MVFSISKISYALFFPPGIFSWDSLNSPSKLQKTPHDGGRERGGKEKNQSMNSYLAFSSSSCSSPHIWSTLRQQLSHTHTHTSCLCPTNRPSHTTKGGGGIIISCDPVICHPFYFPFLPTLAFSRLSFVLALFPFPICFFLVPCPVWGDDFQPTSGLSELSLRQVKFFVNRRRL